MLSKTSQAAGVAILLLCCVAIATAVKQPSRVKNRLPSPPHPLCRLAGLTIGSYLPDPLTIKNGVTIPIDLGAYANVTIVTGKITITGLSGFKFSNCTVDQDMTYISETIPNLDIELNEYTLSGQLVQHIDIYGSGLGTIKTENFFAAISGPLTSGPIPQFESVVLDLDMYQWTVLMEHMMDGTDLGWLFNEFFSEVGPETMDAIEDTINENLSDQLKTIINMLLEAAANALPGPVAIEGEVAKLLAGL